MMNADDQLSQSVIFDGRAMAEAWLCQVGKFGVLKDKGLVIIQADGQPAESKYVRLKREMGERLGVSVRVCVANGPDEVVKLIRESNTDTSINGILVQLPILGVDKDSLIDILSEIDPDKDVDGLNPKSSFVPAVILAVEKVLDESGIDNMEEAVAVVGSAGMVGRRIVNYLEEIGYAVSGFEQGDDLSLLSDFDVVIGATGEEFVIRENMVKPGFVAIDLGYPRPNFEAQAVVKARFATPVPGGVGPLTVVGLYVNLAMT
jgi:methylenetetrahydrofolate dehydrogenase (NADP+) / methenyltetrahydrofolate cyclohydrolase